MFWNMREERKSYQMFDWCHPNFYCSYLHLSFSLQNLNFMLIVHHTCKHILLLSIHPQQSLVSQNHSSSSSRWLLPLKLCLAPPFDVIMGNHAFSQVTWCPFRKSSSTSPPKIIRLLFLVQLHFFKTLYYFSIIYSQIQIVILSSPY